VHGAREAAATAQVDVSAALAYRDFMVSDYTDGGQQAWLSSKGIDLIRGTSRLAGPGVVEADGVSYTAQDVVVATGSDPTMPPLPGLADLEGVWTTREATGMKKVPRRLLILGGGAGGRRDGPGRVPGPCGTRPRCSRSCRSTRRTSPHTDLAAAGRTADDPRPECHDLGLAAFRQKADELERPTRPGYTAQVNRPQRRLALGLARAALA